MRALPSIILAISCSSVTSLTLEAAIEFARDIQPILSDHCYTCHGPDEDQRKADFRIDLKEEAFRDLDGYFALVPGKPSESELIRRIETADTDDVMPPPDAKLALSKEKIALLRQWVEEGAKWEEHWSFIPAKRPNLPPAKNSKWPRNEIDHFVLQKLENHSELTPAEEATPERLLRRVTLDLTGLPPTLDELDTYLNDPSPQGYEKAVDRLLNTAAYAERMALDWMDLARYADSHGMHADGWRRMWPWRDWVIQAFKNNQPYDEFVTWQLAGDLLPNPTDDQIIATAFHRNHAMTAEGGIVDEEFRLQYVFDRAQTTATAFLGMTLECARCHNHKFDPISQKDYYRLTAFFNNLKEVGMTGDDGNYGPMHLLKTDEQKERLASLNDQIVKKQNALTSLLGSAPPESTAEAIEVPKPHQHFPFDAVEMIGEEDKKRKRLDGNEKASYSGTPELKPGRFGQAIEFNGEYDIVSLAKTGLYDSSDSFTTTAWIRPTAGNKPQTIMGNAGGKNNYWRGWDFYLDEDNRLAIKLIHALPHSYIHLRSTHPIELNQWTQVGLTYNGSSSAQGVHLFINGSVAETETIYDRLYKTMYPVSGSADRKPEDRALRLGKAYRSFTGEYGIFTGLIDEVSFWDQALTRAEMALQFNQVGSNDPTPRKVTLPTELVRDHRLRRSHPEVLQTRTELESLYQQRQVLMDSIPEIMVMEELPSPRRNFVLRRGQYDAPLEEVSLGTPESILPFSNELPKNRLGLAQWLFDDHNPLTARVTVNRYWQLFFGKGIVETSEDFGKQGSRPTHPQLLDWLAVEFRDSGWDLKHLCKLIVTSATYRQSSSVPREMRAIDPKNDLLARGPRFRLPAELIRDQALATSGLLVRQVGGPSVKPFQPEGLWIDKGNFSAKLLHYTPDQGDKLYRRSLYTFIRRTSPHPAMVAFDAPNRDVCQVRRERTNTPLQALVLMNDPQFVETARVFAERILLEGGQTNESRIEYAYRLVTSHEISPPEREILVDLLEQETKRLETDPDSVQALSATGNHPVHPQLTDVNLAAMTVVANTLFNHDEFYTKR